LGSQIFRILLSVLELLRTMREAVFFITG